MWTSLVSGLLTQLPMWLDITSRNSQAGNTHLVIYYHTPKIALSVHSFSTLFTPFDASVSTHLTNTIVHSDDGQVKRSRTPTVLLQCSHLWRCASSVKSSQRPCQHGGDDSWCKIQALDGHACRTCSFSLLIATQCQRRGWEAGLQTFPHRSLFALPLFRWQDGNRVRQYLSEVKLNSPRINLTCTHRWSWWGSLGRSSWTCWVFGQASIWISLRK